MSSTTDKIKGTANQAAGKIKKGIGKATNDSELRAKGRAQEAKGDVQKAVGNVKSSVKKAGKL